MKILIIRFSSIGDIVLTTPIVRCIKKQILDAEIHFLCKPEYKNLIETNPYIAQIHFFDNKRITDYCKDGAYSFLTNERFDYIIDLQNNRRSRRLCRKLKTPHAHFPKLNIKKWLLVNFKINKLPNIHLVDRYFTATKILPFPIKNDGQGLDFFIDSKDYEKINTYNIPQPFIAIAMGSQHKTKQLPLSVLIEICKKINQHIVLLGGKKDVETANELCLQVGKTISNLCGKLTLRESAACIDLSNILLTGDTGLMHIAAALNKPIVSVWGNTVPAFGMYPYMPQHPDTYHIIENTNLKCRPCSKVGFEECPKNHFKCMNEIDIEDIVNLLNMAIT
jgi:ADP-heptose:LPS heptosyltransferase